MGCTVAEGAGGGFGEFESEIKLVGFTGVLSISFLGPIGSAGAEVGDSVASALGWIRMSCVGSARESRHVFQRPELGSA